MADKDEDKEAEKPSKKKSIILLAAAFLGITALATGAGFAAAFFLKPTHQKMAEHLSQNDPNNPSGNKKEGESAENGDNSESTGLDGYARPLAPILTNLAAPKDVWVRLEVAVVADPDTSHEMLEDVHQDLLAFMRSTSLHQVEGASGYLNLRAELDDRVSIRSGGKVSRVLVRTIVFE